MTELPFTRRLAEASTTYGLPDAAASMWAKHSILDWLGVTIAGSREPSARMALSRIAAEPSSGRATVVGGDREASAADAALVNGISAHALDYDDGSPLLGAHPSAPIVTAVLAAAERAAASPRAVLEAVGAAHRVQSLLFAAVGYSGYARGFHSTGTLGTIGAAAGVARILGLDVERTLHALGLAATQAAGLKASFGTMGKHLNAAKAAVNAILAADLAALGFTGPADAIESDQGFAVTHSDEFDPERAFASLDGTEALRSLQFKRHACCAGTHSAVEALLDLRAEHGFSAEEIAEVRVTVPPGGLGTYCIPHPRTGLEGKFSIRYAAALALTGRSTGPSSFLDEAVLDPEVSAMRERVHVVVDETQAMEAPTPVEVLLANGAQHSLAHTMRAASDDALPEQWRFLVRKFHDLADPVLGPARSAEMVESIDGFEHLSSVTEAIRASVGATA